MLDTLFEYYAKTDVWSFLKEKQKRISNTRNQDTTPVSPIYRGERDVTFERGKVLSSFKIENVECNCALHAGCNELWIYFMICRHLWHREKSGYGKKSFIVIVKLESQYWSSETGKKTQKNISQDVQASALNPHASPVPIRRKACWPFDNGN